MKNRPGIVDPDFGKPRAFIPTPIIPHFSPGEKYFWVAVEGHSMEDGTKKQIKDKSLVFCREINVEPDKKQLVVFKRKLLDAPTLKPVCIFGFSKTGEPCFIIKTIYFIDAPRFRYLLRSYNPKQRDFWLDCSLVTRLFEVELVRLPNGREFIPKKWWDSCKVHGVPVIDECF